MRFLRAFLIALFTAIVGCLVAFFVGDYLTRLAHVPEMEGQREMTVVFVCAPLGILAGLVIGITSSVLVRRRGFAGFLIAQGWSLLIVCGLAGLLAGVSYLISDKPPRIDGKRLQLQFEVRAPATFKIPGHPDGDSILVSIYTDGLQSRFAFIDWNSITKDAEHVTISGSVPLLTHSKSRSLLVEIVNEPEASGFIELKNLPAAPRKENEAWSDWIFATQHDDLRPIPEPKRILLRYRVRPVDD